MGSPKNRGVGQFIELRGAVGKKEWGGDFDGGGWYPMHTVLYVYVFFSCFLSTKICFSLFDFFFVVKYQILATEYWPFKNQNRWSEIVCGTVFVIAVWLTSDEWVYLFLSCPKLILVSRFKSNWWAQQGFGTWSNYKAAGNLLLEVT